MRAVTTCILAVLAGPAVAPAVPAIPVVPAVAAVPVVPAVAAVPGVIGALTTIAGQTPESVRAHTARALNITDTAHLHFVRETADSTLIEEGKATGGLPGMVKVVFEVGATVRASFTISSRHGTLIGSGLGKPHSAGGEYSSFAGTLTITHGTKRYAHAHGQGGFYGAIDRGNDAVAVQTTGTLAY
jgi:hypothetical protein